MKKIKTLFGYKIIINHDPIKAHHLICFLFLYHKTMTRRGIFILFEGIDRTGKSTQAKLLAEFLDQDGTVCELMRFPDRTTELGQVINNFLSQKENINEKILPSLFSANRYEKKDYMLKKLNEGVNLVVDRYSFSGVAYGTTQGQDFKDLQYKEAMMQLPAPDIIIYLDAPVSVTMKRNGAGDEIYETKDFQTKVKSVYNTMKDDSWYVIDATLSQSDAHLQISDIVLQQMYILSYTSIKNLWEKYNSSRTLCPPPSKEELLSRLHQFV